MCSDEADNIPAPGVEQDYDTVIGQDWENDWWWSAQILLILSHPESSNKGRMKLLQPPYHQKKENLTKNEANPEHEPRNGDGGLDPHDIV